MQDKPQKPKLKAPLAKRRQYALLIANLSKKNHELGLAILYSLDVQSIQETQRGLGIQLSVQMPADCKSPQSFLNSVVEREAKLFGQRIFTKLRIEKIQRGNWAEDYQKYLQPFQLFPASSSPQKTPLFIDPSGKIPKKLSQDTLYIEASLAFGTGTHASTRLAAELLQECLKKSPADCVLDLGCGTGILAMIAKKMGVPMVYATDIDPEALEIAEINFKRNQTEIRLQQDFRKIRKKFDIIVANIILNTLIELKEDLLRHLTSQGRLVLSGLLYSDAAKILSFYKEFKLIQRKNSQGWCSLVLQKIR